MLIFEKSVLGNQFFSKSISKFAFTKILLSFKLRYLYSKSINILAFMKILFSFKLRDDFALNPQFTFSIQNNL